MTERSTTAAPKGVGKAAGKGKRAGKSKGKPAGSAMLEERERSDHTVHFYPIDEVLSALQKAVRRGHARNAAFWAGELHMSGLTTIAVKRLLIMAVEDVGIASPYAPFIAAAAQSMLLAMPDDQLTSSDADHFGPPTAPPPPRLILICGLARWISSLPKTRTSCMLSSFQRAKAEERERHPCDVAGALRPCTVDDVGVALSNLYARVVGDPANFCRSPRNEDDVFLRMEEDVFLRAYAYQLCQKTEALALEPLFEVLGLTMLKEERRLKSCMPRLGSDTSGSMVDLVSGFSSVRKMVLDLQSLSTGTLDSAARMALCQALLLATRAHHLVLEGVIVVPSMLLQENDTTCQIDVGMVCSSDLTTLCKDCDLFRLDGKAIARRNARIVSHYSREKGASTSPVAVNLQAFVRTELASSCLSFLPKDLLECLMRPAVDAKARYLRVPPYCVDIHTRRGSGYPMHRDWDDRILPLNPGLLEWDREEKWKTHGELDAQGRRMASQFTRYGLVVSDEYFPGPSGPTFDMALRPKDWARFQTEVLPVASLDHGEAFVDRRHFPDGYGSCWETCTSVVPREETNDLSELAAWIKCKSPTPPKGQYCTCSRYCFYRQPAMPHDPYFRAIKTFMSWSSENSFPSPADFPGGKLPKILESIATSTINDDPGGKKLTQTEHLFEQTEGLGQGLAVSDEKRSAIDSRPSKVTELHRARMQRIQAKLAAGVPDEAPKVTETPVTRNKDKPWSTEDTVPSKVVDVIKHEPKTSPPGEIETGGAAPRRSRWNRK
eukprot:TRINITY_DN64414_c0_g1_i1.p1 TRINITY_DN64414_c0_g1~~TRINITY_DN64414_c0_g1_i1.p1  ORF type:complete len:777 (+),score=88.65 TRINITY_DN64414_c0_g1_i1:113-2443(+)